MEMNMLKVSGGRLQDMNVYQLHTIIGGMKM